MFLLQASRSTSPTELIANLGLFDLSCYEIKILSNKKKEKVNILNEFEIRYSLQFHIIRLLSFEVDAIVLELFGDHFASLD